MVSSGENILLRAL
jgi:hypothetical protein